MTQFNQSEKRHISKSRPVPYKVLLERDPKTASNKLWLQFDEAAKNYFYWKENLKGINETLIDLKKAKTQHYLHKFHGEPRPICSYNLQTINEKLYWWRSYYPKALSCYRDAKQDYLEAQKYCLDFANNESKRRVDAKDFKGKYCYRITCKHGDNWTFVYYVRSSTDYLDENNFKDEFEYDMELAVERFGDDLKKFNWNANWELNNTLKFYRSDDIKTTVDKISEDQCGDVLVDFEEFHAWRKGESVKEKERLNFYDYVKYKEYNGGPGVCKGFKTWLYSTFRDMLEKQYYGHEGMDVIELYWKRTIHSWDRYFEMWSNNETPESRREKKCSK